MDNLGGLSGALERARDDGRLGADGSVEPSRGQLRLHSPARGEPEAREATVDDLVGILDLAMADEVDAARRPPGG